MSKRRVKQQNVSVIGLFKLDGMRKWMAFSYTRNVRAQAGVTLQKIKTNSIKNNVCHVPFTMFVRLFAFSYAFPIRFVYYLFVCLFFKCLSYTFCLVVRFK